MASNFYLKKGDVLPRLKATLKNGSGVAINLTGATVVFRMRKSDAAEPKVEASATVTGATAGLVEYTWDEEDSDEVGSYNGEFVITFPSGVQTVPSNGFFTIEVVESLAV